jgi:DNA-binding GntR family transcriptional regulator
MAAAAHDGRLRSCAPHQAQLATTVAHVRPQARSDGPLSSGPAIGKGLQHRTIAAACADALRQRILQGQLPAGSALRQDALALEFGDSRIPLREALVQLEAEGLVKIVPHRGAIVSELSVEDIDEIFELRLRLEPYLLRRSAPHLTPEDYAELRQLLADYREALREERVTRWGELNASFHLILYRRADRQRTTAIVAGLLQDGDRLTRMQLAFTRDFERANSDHALLIELCASGKVREASALLTRHIENVRRSLKLVLARQPSVQS